MQDRTSFRLIMMLGSVLAVTAYTMPSVAQTGPRITTTPAAPQTAEVLSITNQAEWQNAVALILQRYGQLLARELAPLELDGVFKPKISFYLSPEGTVSDVKLVERSGDDLVDAAALKVPTAGAAFPAFTPDMASDKPKKLIAPFEVRLHKTEPETPELPTAN
ncbi:energy transducer TonB [Brucella pituitosa]|nr:energy transducer TonB [Brucella pituitosa]MCK4206208.1 energy transducer TonB [Brucella pituitosa]PJO49418.1 hypothetical protein CWE02_06550 [Brucella pituitosa]PRA85461.1 hypothetical protein CQ054_12140 [Ochrobactrum sp. MYb29]